MRPHRNNAYDKDANLRATILLDNRVKVLDYCRMMLTTIDLELLEDQPSEARMRQNSDIIISALSVAFHNEGEQYVACDRER